MSADWIRPVSFAGLDGITATFTTRAGGVSRAPYGSLNLGSGTEDDRESVVENRRLVTQALGFGTEDLAVAGQVHGAEVETVVAGGLFPGRDGLVTDRAGVLLAIVAADCAAVLLADPVARVIGACHAGWRGAVGGVVEHTLDAMAVLGADRSRVAAWVSPCIGWQAFQVGPEVAERFDPADIRTVPGDDRPHVDLAGAIVRRLLGAGLDPSAVSADGRCTASDPDRFFSHRAQRGITGRMMGLIGLRAAGT